MGTTYTQLLIHVVLVVKYRRALITSSWEESLYRYMNVALNDMDSKPLAINSMPDHVHLLMVMNQSMALSKVMQRLKVSTTKWINNNKFCKGHFRWQAGYAAFSVSRHQLEVVRAYIKDQKRRHQKKAFIEEFDSLMRDKGIYYKKIYSFKPPE